MSHHEGSAHIGRKVIFRGVVLFAAIVSLAAGAVAEASEDLWFPVGEKMEYKLYWGIIPVGRAEFQTFWDKFEGRDAVVLRATARTTAIVAALYPVEDVIESVVDPKTFLPLKYTQKLREGRHERDDEVLFDHAKGVATWRKIGKSDETKTITIDKDTRDVLTLTYMMRGGEFAVDEKRLFKVLVDDKLYSLFIQGIKREKLKVGDYGKMDTLELEPHAKFGGIFVRKGKVRLWFSLDDRKVCVRMTGKVPLADVKAILTKVSGPGDDFWVSDQKD